jgi:hypothetical protein
VKLNCDAESALRTLIRFDRQRLRLVSMLGRRAEKLNVLALFFAVGGLSVSSAAHAAPVRR